MPFAQLKVINFFYNFLWLILMVYKYKKNFKKHSYPAYFLSYIIKTAKIHDFRGNLCFKILNFTHLLRLLYFFLFNINAYKKL